MMRVERIVVVLAPFGDAPMQAREYWTMDIVLPDGAGKAMVLGWFACSTLLVAGFSLSAGIGHLFDWWYQKRDEDSLAFSLVCLSVAGHAITLVFLYRAFTVAGYVLALKVDLSFLLVAQAAFVWFVTTHMRVEARRVTLWFAAYFGVLFAANLISENSLMASGVSNLLLQQFPGGDPYVSAVLVPSAWNPFCLVGTFATYAYCLYVSYKGRHNVERGEVIVMVVSVVCLFATWLQTVLVDPAVSSVVILSHYAFLAFIFLMGSAMSSRYGRQALSLAITHKALSESEERFRVLVEKAPDAIVVLDLDRGRFVDANPNAAALFGCSQDELLSSPVGRFQAPAAPESASPADIIRALGEQALQGAEPTFEQTFRNMAGKDLVCEVRLARLPSTDRRLIRASLIDITERKQAEQHRFEYQQQLRSLASELALTEERERKRIAMYLHDQVAQGLVAARLKLSEAASEPGRNGDGQRLGEVRSLLDRAVEDTYSLTFELSLPILYELGLMPAIEWLGERICENNGIRFRLVDDGAPKPLGNDLRGACFYVIRELLLNVVKHAQAKHVTVTARAEAAELWLTVQDDGVGFEVPSMNRARKSGGFGMFGVRERIEYLGGTLNVESSPGRGTRITLSAPLDIRAAQSESIADADQDSVGG